MINKKYIEDLIHESLRDTDRFVVGLKISTDNKISVFIDGDSGVTIRNCVELSRHIEGNLDREKEDFELNVASAGADHPFTLLRQYKNNIGNSVQVTDTDGIKVLGKLISADGNGVEIHEEIKNKNKKVKKTILGDIISIPMERIKETKRIITF